MARYRPVMDLLIKIYRQAPAREDGEVSPLAERFLGEDYAYRRDRRVVTSEIGDTQVYETRREYVTRREEEYEIDVPPPQGVGYGLVGSDPIGGAAPNVDPVTAAEGSNAQIGLLLEDTETGELFDITGVTLMPDRRNEVIHCERHQ